MTGAGTRQRKETVGWVAMARSQRRLRGFICDERLAKFRNRPTWFRCCGSSRMTPRPIAASFSKKSISTIELAEHILARAARGERNITRLKQSAFKMLGFGAWKNDSDAVSGAAKCCAALLVPRR
jgi:hypothetical protein